MASKLQGMISNIAEQRKAVPKAPVINPTTTNDISTMTKPADFINTAKTPVPVATPTVVAPSSITQGVTTPTPVAQTPVKAPVINPTAPKVIGEQNGVVQYEKPQVTT